MDYEEKYNKALERAKKLEENSNGMILKKWLWNIFPELKESDDEKVRKHLISLFEKFVTLGVANECETSEIKVDDILAWLEKQEEFVSIDFDDVWEWADGDELTAPLEKYSKDAIKEMCHAWYDKGIELERKSWLKKQHNNNEIAKGILRGAAIHLITWIDYNAAEGNMCLSNMECKDIENALVNMDWDRIYAYIKKKLEKQDKKNKLIEE